MSQRRPLARPTAPAAAAPTAAAEEVTPVEDATPVAADEAEGVAAPAAAAIDSTDTPPPAPVEQSPTEDTEPPAREPDAHRCEEFDATRPDGTVVRVRRNIDTGEQSVTPV